MKMGRLFRRVSGSFVRARLGKILHDVCRTVAFWEETAKVMGLPLRPARFSKFDRGFVGLCAASFRL